MSALFKNNATALLAASISSSGTTLVLAAGTGIKFPVLTGSDYFYGTIYDSAGNFEIVKVTSRSADSLTLVRAQEGTTALAFSSGDAFALRVTAASLNDFVQKSADQTITSDNTFSGTNTHSGTENFTGVTNINNPTLTGTVTVPTQSGGDNTTKAASTAFVVGAVGTAIGALGTMSTQNANSVSITGGSVSGITDMAVADGGTGVSSLTANAVVLGNGTSPVQTVSPGTSGNVLTSNGTTWVSGAGPAPTSGSGGLGNGSTFSITTGSSGVALITVEFLSIANVGNFGGATGYLAINGSTVASKYTQTIEYSSRNSGCSGTILYRYAGSPNSTVTGQFSWGGAGNLNSASYMYIGI